MAKYKIFWTFSDSGKSIVKADSEDEAREKFSHIPLNYLFGSDDYNGAHIMQITKIKEAGE